MVLHKEAMELGYGSMDGGSMEPGGGREGKCLGKCCSAMVIGYDAMKRGYGDRVWCYTWRRARRQVPWKRS